MAQEITTSSGNKSQNIWQPDLRFKNMCESIEIAFFTNPAGYKALGKGVSGTVFKLLIPKSLNGPQDEVVIKLFHENIHPLQIESEAKFLKILQKFPHFPQLYFVGNRSFIMKFAADNLWKSYLDPKKKKEMKPEDLQALTIHLLEALDVLFSKQIVHADIKPANICHGNGETTLLDFGNSIYASDPQTPRLIQAAPYRSPECMAQKIKIDFQADMWSLGCLLFEMCTGEELFPSRDEKSNQDPSKQANQPVHFLAATTPVLGIPPENFRKESRSVYLNKIYDLYKGNVLEQWASKNPDHIENKIINAGRKNNYPEEFIIEFADLVKRMIHWDPEDRIYPSDALSWIQHWKIANPNFILPIENGSSESPVDKKQPTPPMERASPPKSSSEVSLMTVALSDGDHPD